ncbi:LPXTG cell wall anchor domain-containing protein [Evansella sp. AB-P1]|uniref:immunoglobulin-like domain-containing protein n=1 Tax=Evansella sp. AB-P1 TaxID=3037653 RepID=UPI00241E7C24|nr:immunoglobulin-like domain-containing protein [Evansella sp. AB-P1]MDG5789445.1 LPXTG cell wall anchor domain-containing protein [Evansella sp. AB-P1]
MLKKQVKLLEKNLLIFLCALLAFSPLLTTAVGMKEVTAAGGISISNLKGIEYQEGDGPVQVAPEVEITGGGSYGDGYVRFGINGMTSSETLSIITVNSPSDVDGEVSIVDSLVYLGNGTGYRQIGTVNRVLNGKDGHPIQIDFSTPLVNSGFEEEVKSASITSQNQMGQTHRINGWDITLGEYRIDQLKQGTQGTLVTSGTQANDFRMQFQVQSSEKSTGNYALRLESRYWVNERSSHPHNLRNPNYAVFHGPWAISDAFYAYKEDTIALDWSAVNGGDDYDVYAFLENVETGNEIELFYGRGFVQPWITTGAEIPADGNYRFKFISGSYDATGGGLMGASLYIDNIRYFGNAANDAVVQQVARLITYENTSPDPDLPERTLEIEIKNADNKTTTVTEEVQNEALIHYAQGDNSGNVTQDLVLVTEPKDGATIQWSSDSNLYINADTGEVTRPSHVLGDQQVVLTARIPKNGNTTTKTFTVNVKAGLPAPEISVDTEAFKPVQPGVVELSINETIGNGNKVFYRIGNIDSLPLNLGQKVKLSSWSVVEGTSASVQVENGSYIEVVEIEENLVVKWSRIGPTDDGKPLQDAIDKAELTLEKAENSKERYTSVGGNTGDAVYSEVVREAEDLKQGLDANPQLKDVIKDKTDTLISAIKSLESASDEKELQNALKAANEVMDDAEQASLRYQGAGGKKQDSVFEALILAHADLDDVLNETPKDVRKIEAATALLREAVGNLNKASEALELANAVAAAEAEKDRANTVQGKFTTAGGDSRQPVFADVVVKLVELDILLNANPKNKELIETATSALNKAIDQLLIASEELELINAVVLANAAIISADQGQARYENANGDKEAEVFEAVNIAKEHLEELLDTPTTQDTVAIKTATNDLQEAVELLNKASELKELENTLESAEEVLEFADRAEERFNNAGGEQLAVEYQTVQWRKFHLKSLLENPLPHDKDEIKAASLHLYRAVKAVERLSDDLELKNALEKARVASEAAEKIQTRYDNANGDKEAEVYRDVLTAKVQLDTLVNADPQNTEAIESATKNLLKAVKELEKASEAKELENALEAAEAAQLEAEKVETRYEKADGDKEAEEYGDVQKAKSALAELVEATPQNTETIKSATKNLLKTVKELEKASEAKELENALEAAEAAQTTAEKVENRYSNADGDKEAEVYGDVQAAKSALAALVDENPQNTEAIESATKNLLKAVKELEKASEAKELENALESAESALLQAEKVETRYEKADGDIEAEVYGDVQEAKKALAEKVGTTPQHTEAIESATKNLLEAVKELEKASEAKELENALEAAKLAQSTSEKVENRYEKADGDKEAEVYEDVQTAKSALAELVEATPQNTEAIKSATKNLLKAVKELEKASEAKELENALESAEAAQAKTKKAENRYSEADGDKAAEVYEDVQAAKSALAELVDENPQNTEAIEAATKNLLKAVKELEKASEAKELENALDAAESAQAKAEKVETRYTKADGDKEAEVYEEVQAEKKALAELVEATPQNTEAIETATKNLLEAIKELEKASEAKELENALESAEAAQATAEKVENSYSKADGDKEAEVYADVQAAKAALAELVDENPQNTEAIESATKNLLKTVKELEKASEAKELENALESAEAAQATAEKAENRYTKADGDKAAEVYEEVQEAKATLAEQVGTAPQNTEAIESATKNLLKAVKELEKASEAKELENALKAAEVAQAQAEKAMELYRAADGDINAKVYEVLYLAVSELNSLIEATPQDTKAIHTAAEQVNATVDQINNVTSTILKGQLFNKIDEMNNVSKMSSVYTAIEEAALTKEDRQMVFGYFTDKALLDDSTIVFHNSEDLTKVEHAITHSDKSSNAKENAYIRLAEKGIRELSVTDVPTKDQKFQKVQNQTIEFIIQKVSAEQERLTVLHELTVDALSLTRENAFTFQNGDTWESITTNFFALNAGAYGTKISWESSNGQVISVTDDIATVTRKTKDESSILTATISHGGQVTERTFLLIVKRTGAGEKVTETVLREATVDTGLTNNNHKVIQRINLLDQNSSKIINKIDKLIVTDEMIPESQLQTVKVHLPSDVSNKADEYAIEIPLDVLEKITGDLEVRTDYGVIFISSDEIEAMQAAKIDLYFRFVPVNDQGEQENLGQRLSDSSVVIGAVTEALGESGQIKILGNPIEIETNYKGYSTDVILPLEDIYYEGIDLEMLRVYIEHSDGDIVVQEGEIVFDENGFPQGFKFSINKFSVFTIFEITEPEVEEETVPVLEETTKEEVEVEKEAEEDLKEAKEVSKENKQELAVEKDGQKVLPSTATSMYTTLFVGLLILIIGFSLLFIRKKQRIN